MYSYRRDLTVWTYLNLIKSLCFKESNISDFNYVHQLQYKWKHNTKEQPMLIINKHYNSISKKTLIFKGLSVPNESISGYVF